MRALAVVLFVLFCFQQTIGMSVGGNRQGSRREVREVDAPAPIDCKMSAWSAWGECDPCSKTMHRSRGIEVFGQFGGRKCIEPIGDKTPCVPTTKCEQDPPPVCKSTEFQCESGVCIKQRLVCNGDNDCDDFSDEDECEKIRAPCGNIPVTESDIGRAAGYGINILGAGPRMNPFNNKVYNGMCERVKDPSTLQYNRLPWNVAVLNFETVVEESSSKEIYEDTHSLIKELTEETTTKTSLGLSFKFTPTENLPNNSFSFSTGFNTATDNSNIVKTITEDKTIKGKTFIRVKGKVQLGTYRLRSRNLEVSETFLDNVDALPIKYEKGQYFGFMEDYGTHYTKNGKSGGEYDLVYVLNSETMSKKKVTETTVKNCLKLSFNADFQIINASLGQFDPGLKTTPKDDCRKLTDKEPDAVENKAIIDKVISSVRGGSPQSAAAMKSQLTKEGLLDWKHFAEWARSIGDLPALIYSDPEPIYNAIPLTFPDSSPRRDNLQRALHEYMAEYSVCKCQPCKNGGTVAQIDGQCVCLCPVQFEGIACQILRHELMKDNSMPVQQEGNWGCWSAWSNCSGGRRTRKRSCNPGTTAGATCKGDTVIEEYC